MTMATITEDYVGFEIAKLLKEKGFDDIDCECHGWIGRSGKHYSSDDTFYDDKELKKAQEDRKDFIPLITLQMAMKWLREVYKYIIEIHYGNVGSTREPKIQWWWELENKQGEFLDSNITDANTTYEEACESAIKYCLKNLI